MLRYLYADQLHRHPRLARQMFEDRAAQFAHRLGWDVEVDAAGEERDAYDAMNPLYVIWEEQNGRHGGSMRFLPTTGPVMVNDHFGHLISGPVCSPLIWECTRFCLAQGAGPHVAAALMLAGGEIMHGFGIRHFVGVFDARMVRIYRMIGSSPDVLGAAGQGRDRISVGLWGFCGAAQERVARRAGISPEQSRFWFDQAFGSQMPAVLQQTA
ncbi:Acyl-homoserine-lactone synthase [Sulfitobacter sp. THAF37]|uniref:acyl-homoserine-lactone synthase n=1 Tax=Sulfitobacter sp. THAF37 TaxID=2587855 RepID=UPI001267E3AF|nr:acyl-homoserine-lactone synthase [Sulfitobacter sp. THAF37]QFT59001.1 Acyl-homoserine-lactone synthase [Sulfitobacter sp. THAF37]